MGLAVSQIELLRLTREKSRCELNISLKALDKQNLTNESSKLATEYNSKLKQQCVVYYADGKYNEVNLEYFTGYTNLSMVSGTAPVKDDNRLILTDCFGYVIMPDNIANAIMSVCGIEEGGDIPDDKIPEIMNKLFPGFTKQEFENGFDDIDWTNSVYNALTGNNIGTSTTTITNPKNEMIQRLLAFYTPIFEAATANGWTTKYNESIKNNSSYVSDALTSGTFVISEIDSFGHIGDVEPLSYYTMSGRLEKRTDAEKRELVTVEYEAKREELKAKEDAIDIDMKELSAKLEAINTEIQSIQALIKDDINMFSWGGGG